MARMVRTIYDWYIVLGRPRMYQKNVINLIQAKVREQSDLAPAVESSDITVTLLSG